MKAYPSDSPMNISLNLMIASELDKVAVVSLQYLQKAVDLAEDKSEIRLDCLVLKGSNHLKNGNYIILSLSAFKDIMLLNSYITKYITKHLPTFIN